MGGLEVERLIAAGASQSAARLRTYINGVHPLTELFDGYLPFIDFGGVVPFASEGGGGRRGRSLASVRSDLDVPVIVVNSETELNTYYPIREPDSDRFRLWEVPGTSHVSVARAGGTHRRRLQLALLHAGVPGRDPTSPPLDQGRRRTAEDAARGDEGREIPTPKSSVTSTATPEAAFACRKSRRRPPRTAASARRGKGRGSGSCTAPRPTSTVNSSRTLYPDSEHYLDAWSAALDRAIEQGMILPEDAPEMRERAAEWAARLDVPPR